MHVTWKEKKPNPNQLCFRELLIDSSCSDLLLMIIFGKNYYLCSNS